MKNIFFPVFIGLLAVHLSTPDILFADSTEDLFQKGMDLKRQEKFEEAAQVFARIVQSQPKHVDALQQLATLQGWLNQYEESIQTWRRALALDPNNMELLIGLARVLTWNEDFYHAETEYRKALNLNPNSYDALVGMGDIEMRREDPAEARKFYVRAQAMQPADADLKKKLAGAVPPLRFRVDLGYAYDDYSQTRGSEAGTFVQFSRQYRAFHRMAAWWLRHEWLHHFGGVDNTVYFGEAFRPFPAGAVQVELGLTPSNKFQSNWQGNLELDFPLNAFLTPSVTFRHYDYDGGGVQIYTPAVRFQPKPWAALIYKHSFSENISGPATNSWQGQVEFNFREKVVTQIGYSNGDESLPPQSVAFNDVIFTNLIWNIGRHWGVRLDYSHERRPNFYTRNSTGFSLTAKF